MSSEYSGTQRFLFQNPESDTLPVLSPRNWAIKIDLASEYAVLLVIPEGCKQGPRFVIQVIRSALSWYFKELEVSEVG